MRTTVYPVPSETDSQDVKSSYPQPGHDLASVERLERLCGFDHTKMDIAHSKANPVIKKAQMPAQIRMENEEQGDGGALRSFATSRKQGAQNRIAPQRSLLEEALHGSGGDCPPPLLGGLKTQEVINQTPKREEKDNKQNRIGIDWLQGTFDYSAFNAIKSYLVELCGGKVPESLGRGYLGFQNSLTFEPFEIKMMWDEDPRNKGLHGNRWLLQMNGTSLKSFPAGSVYLLFSYLHGQGMKATRTDLAFDDCLKIITPRGVLDMLNEHEGCVSGFRSYCYYEGKRFVSKDGETGFENVLINQGITFGTRGKNGSGRFLRCYDKERESKGEIDAIRWEVEYSKDVAHKVFCELATCIDLKAFCHKIGKLIGGAIDFIPPRGKKKRRYPQDRLDFWKKIVQLLGVAKIRRAAENGSIEKTEKWIAENVTPAFAKLVEAKGEHYVWEYFYSLVEQCGLSDRAIAQIECFHRIHGKPDKGEAVAFEKVPF